MIALKINDLDVTAPDGATILEAARSVGIHIPTLCHLDMHDLVCRVLREKLAQVFGIGERPHLRDEGNMINGAAQLPDLVVVTAGQADEKIKLNL